MGKGGGGTQTTISKTELPAWLEDVTKENLSRAQQISDRPYIAYGGDLVAGFNPQQEQAFQYGLSGVGEQAPNYQAAQQAAAGVAGYRPERVSADSIVSGAVGSREIGSQNVTAQNFLQGNIGDYLNPYIQNVEDRAIANAQRSAQMNINQLGASAARAGAFGGSRLGVSEGVAAAEAARGVGDLSAQLRSQGFQQAQGIMSQDQGRALQAAIANQDAALRASSLNQSTGLQAAIANQDAALRASSLNQSTGLQASLANQAAGLQGGQLNLQAAGQMGDLAGQAQQSRLADLGVLSGIGEQQQGLQQRRLDEEYARFLEERNAPIEALNLRLAATSATPYGQTQTQTGPGPQGPNALMTGLGAAASVASIIGAL